MRDNEIARRIRQEANSLSNTVSNLNALADELEGIEASTPTINHVIMPKISDRGKCYLQSERHLKRWDCHGQPYIHLFAEMTFRLYALDQRYS
mgnify:FL=1